MLQQFGEVVHDHVRAVFAQRVRLPEAVHPDHAPEPPGPAGARALRLEPGEAAVFEDALAGVAAGRAGRVGCVFGVDRRGQADALREHGADVVVADLAELLEHP